MPADPIQPAEGASAPAPLTADETRRLWAWERKMVRLAAMTIMVLAGALGAAHLYGDDPLMRSLVLGVGILFLLAVIAMQLRERCPRCDARLAGNMALVLPARCSRCGVAFPRPIDADGELDN